MDNTPQETEVREQPPAERKTSARSMTRGLFALLALLVVAGIAWGISMYQANRAVAEVNGEVITQKEYERAIQGITDASALQGVDVSDPAAEQAIRTQALQALIDRALIINAAGESGVEVTEAELDARITDVQTQVGSEESYQQELSNLGLSEAEFREEVRTQLRVEKFVDANLPEDATTVTDEEVQEAYDIYVESVGGAANAPTFEEVEPMLRLQLTNAKTTEAVQGILEGLRAEADIEVFLDQQVETPPLPPANETNEPAPDVSKTSAQE